MAKFWADKTVIVTGAARGQGAVEASALLRLGARVHALDISESYEADWDALRQTASQAPGSLFIERHDVSDPAAWETLSSRLSARGERIHGLVNNAGVTLRKTVTATSPEEWRRLMSINLDGAFYGIHFMAPLMRDGGSIVNIASTAGLTGYFGASYSVSKWGLRGLTRTAAQELASRSIRVNCICPGLLDQPMMNASASSDPEERTTETFHESCRQATPLARGAQPEEIAKVVMFLLGPDSSFITAADVPVDGGLSGAGLYWQIGKKTGNL
ncbi:SDR family NAD(P)-dependent oxidoreductase [Aminobacter aminovorans]|uniref:NAD(P)-dependent dehydrogenase (Short-subunit alcohol dehydrogenase family) n=1 Tax=Aminobacter aminovorans TaxID=83263 RepID=A0AAC9ATL2_AMIAI|nr:SDR family NAD(P)-dependent oxidoreductase [Aminobacter aminovorans]AMS45479.1 short-chain dehydrogenase [Aminobacter aminovorans]MBB3708686.1 NAD(P)-dependent dehydrogenase (short-subunit alcohol dehydrogenase family) [Aminobacter aminovorans]